MTRECKHKKVKMRYLEAHEDADKRIARGEQQKKCPVCNKWIWTKHYFKEEN